MVIVGYVCLQLALCCMFSANNMLFLKELDFVLSSENHKKTALSVTSKVYRGGSQSGGLVPAL